MHPAIPVQPPIPPPFPPAGRERVALCRQGCRSLAATVSPAGSVLRFARVSRPSPSGGFQPALTRSRTAREIPTLATVEIKNPFKKLSLAVHSGSG